MGYKNHRAVFYAAAAAVCAALISGCAGAPANAGANTGVENEAAAAAAAALDAMDRAGSGSGSPLPGGPAAEPPALPGESPVTGGVGGAEPSWIMSPQSVYDRGSYLAAVGYGPERLVAEKSAFTNLAALFGQSVQGEIAATTKYSEAVTNGVVSSWSENTAVIDAVKTSVRLESLVGAEIRDYWYDGKSTHYAVAVMDRAKTASLYTEMIRSNEEIITGLVTMNDAERNTLDGFSRYRLAGAIADANRVFANVLSMVGAGGAGTAMKRGDEYRLEAAKITGNIPIAVGVSGDRAGRVRGAFASALNGQGFKSGGGDARYRLTGSIVFSPVELPGQQNKFVRYTVEADLVDTLTGNVLLPYIITGREGHTSVSEAENRAVTAAARKIETDYGKILSDYLDDLLPNPK